MIEDALKTTRTIHRLIVAVSLVTLVFSLSLSVPEQQRRWKVTVDQLLDADFDRYREFVDAAVEDATQLATPAAAEISTALDRYLVFGTDDIGAALVALHVGRVLTEELVVADMPAATLTELSALNGLDLGRDVQIAVPRTEDLVASLERFFGENAGFQGRITSVSANLESADFSAQSFLPGDTVHATLYFELRDVAAVGAAPVFQAGFIADIREVPDSSFLDWLATETKLTEVVTVDNGRVVFAPQLSDAPGSFREQSLGVLALQLQEDLEKTSPQANSATILGTNVPGLLVIFAAPLVLGFLSYYFLGHIGHLRRIATADPASVRRFAWLPTSLTAVVSIALPHNGTLVLSAWVLELVVTAVLLPVASLATLYWQLVQFGPLGLVPTILITAAAAVICLSGSLSARRIAALRQTTNAGAELGTLP